MGRVLGLVLTIIMGAASFTCGCCMHDDKILLPEESVIGGAAVAVWGEQRGDVHVCSWEVKGLVCP